MRLSAIILQGFKSFRESTRIQFDANPVVIIGPNGCGKSNTVDAVRWVLGESSARQLRGGSLSDVISNGGGSRPAALVATVELRFDNSDGAAPGAFAGAAEISVRRSLDRKGDGHYRINGARCRRRDVGDLFLGTGLGGNAYAIVEQGTVGRIVDARPDDLRAILEEAGGISRYKERRRETTQRIAETREHLQRLYDIHGEMDGQWQRLQRQAESAQRLRALRMEERQWQWWGLTLRVDALEAERRQSLEQRSRLQAKYRREAHLLDAVTQSLDQLRAEDRRMQENIAAAQGELYAVQAQQSDMEHQLREHQAALQRVQTSLDQGQAQQQKVRSEQTCQAEDENQRQRRLQDLAARRQALSGEEDSARRLRREAERELEKQDEERQNQQQALAEMRRKRDVTTAQIRELEPRLEDIERRLQQQSANIPSERAAMEALAALCDAAETVLAEAASDLRTHREALETLQTRIVVLRNARDDTLAKAQEYGARQKALEGLLQRLQKPQARNDPAGSRLVDQIRVQPRWERALEEVLGDRLNALVMEGNNMVTQGSMLWVSTVMPVDLPPDALLQVLEMPETLTLGLSDWLWGLRMAPDLASALDQRHQLRAGEAWITPQGVLVHRSGVAYPEHEDGASLLQCRRELAENGECFQRAQADAAAAHAALIAAEQQARTLQEQVRRADARWQEMGRQSARERESLVRLRSRVETEERQRAERAAESQRLDVERNALETRLYGLRQELAADDRGWQDLEQAVLDSRRMTDTLRRRVDELRGIHGRVRGEYQALELRQQRLQAESEAAIARAKDLQQQWDQLAATVAENEGELLRLQAALPEMLEARDAVGALRADRSVHLEALQSAAQTAEQQIREQESHLHALDNGLRALQKSEAAVDQQLAGLQARLDELQQRAAVLAQDLGDDPGPCPDATRCEESLTRIGAAIASLGNVNLAAEDELRELEGRRDNLQAQVEDVESALHGLAEAMAAMDLETTVRFRDTLDKVNQALQELFAVLFGGGQAQLSLVGEDVLDAGLVLRAQPPGKRNATLQQLSGGEKALTAIALVFALFHLNPAPFCILDEVDAPLDDANVGRFCHLVQKMAAQTQFLIVTHRSLTMQVAEQLVGVTMTEPGVSRVVRVDVADTLAQTASREGTAP